MYYFGNQKKNKRIFLRHRKPPTYKMAMNHTKTNVLFPKIKTLGK